MIKIKRENDNTVIKFFRIIYRKIVKKTVLCVISGKNFLEKNKVKKLFTV